MARAKTLQLVFLAGFVWIGVYAGQVPLIFAQGESNIKQSDTRQKMTEQQINGESLFMQRCSLCHVNRKYKTGVQPTFGTGS